MKISELIAAVGDDKVAVQNLDICADSLNMKGGVTRITFGTNEPLTLTGTARLGLIVWLDRDAVKAATAALAKETSDDDRGRDDEKPRRR